MQNCRHHIVNPLGHDYGVMYADESGSGQKFIAGTPRAVMHKACCLCRLAITAAGNKFEAWLNSALQTCS